MERVGVVGLDLDCWRARKWASGSFGSLQCWSAGSGRSTPLQKQERRGRRGLLPWPLRCLSQFLSEGKKRLLRERMCGCKYVLRMSLRTFHRRGGHVFIVDIRPVG